jgi:predicted transcriptional regulator
MDTTIQVSRELVDVLNKRKLNQRESYENIIWDLLEDTMELSEETKKEIAIGRKEIKEGKFVSLEQIKKKYGIR